MTDNKNPTLEDVQRIISEIGEDCVLIGGWASYLHLQGGALSHDVDTILNPQWDKQRVVQLIGGQRTHLGKYSGQLHDVHVDLYAPRDTVGDIPVEKFLPYTTRIKGVRVLIPEAHILTKAACVWDDGRFMSDRAPKDLSEVRGMMGLINNSRVPIALWSNLVEDNTNLTDKWNLLMSRVEHGISKKDRKKTNFDAQLREWKQSATDVQETLADTYPVKENLNVMYLPVGDGVVSKFQNFKGGNPSTVATLNDDMTWTRTMAVVAGEGKTLLQAAQRSHPYSRAVPESTAVSYGQKTNCCLMCGRELSTTASRARGYGPECASKLR